ncbi:Rne/Rng family ribonuclease [Malikia sp.]|uniref:Rne/Rng family ribonuclease n=1 Tax=Malikia sp. TaxID=2070706 RepID=UPI00261364D8|nr:Rne/Rng family ribonuclease [Malikia sp.]MDD2727558.1 Rne/Rng family ribonuclease [Malikia sp.]
MKRMLINATQAEERRLAIVDGQKLLDYEIEIEGREQRKGNIYKAVVTRVEPSLEACFVDYGEDRHGFLPFKEISRQYFQGGASPSQARIQDVIREGQELLVQVEKEERGNKGAALTTFVSLAGRYVVLMPNNPRGGGVSRRIEGEDRAELKAALEQLDYPNGMSIIARTAGIGREAGELQWDLNYLLKLWNAIDGAAKAGKGAFLIYQESSLVIRAIRDYFNNDIGEILIDTDDIFEQAHQFMAHVMPEQEHRVKRYRDDAPLFSRFQIEHQIETAYSRTVTLPSGGAIVIDQTEALVAVDVNSARSIKGGDIEETATRTNLEAADEVARQARLRDLGGLIVIDFIDMEESRNRREVENRLRDALRQDRARVQFGSISKFGLLEMSRQRLRPALNEGASIPCPRCGGSGHIRDTESSALQILRIIQEESLKESTAAVLVQVPVEVASFLLNEKRTEITKIELKQRISVLLVPNKSLDTPHYKLERLKHDDPRLEQLDASYKMAEEVEDVATFTRRSQERSNKQEPLIKGVLPDAPAPVSTPKPEAVAPAAAPVATAATAPARAVPAPETGFMAWLKRLFGMAPNQAPLAPAAPVAVAPSPAPAAAPAAREARPENRGNRGERGGERGGERSERGERGNRNGRGERPLESRNGERQGQGQGERSVEGRRSERNRGEGRTSEAREGREGRGEPRREGRRDTRPEIAATETVALNLDNGQSAIEAAEGNVPAEGRRERSEGRRRGPRNEGYRNAPAAQAEAAQAAEAPVLENTEASDEPGKTEAAQAEPRAARERRSRDRYGRDRRSRGEAAATAGEESDAQAPAFEPVAAETREVAAAPRSYFTAGGAASAVAEAAAPVELAAAQQVAVAAAEVQPVEPSRPVQAQAAAEAAPAMAPTPAVAVTPAVAAAAPAAAMPPVQAYRLAIDELSALAQNVGLEWIQSDADKVAQVQAAIAAEPKPVRVPREPKPVVLLDEGPLILVETRRDLSELKLPFEA